MKTIPIKYVGLKETGDSDHLYGTNIVWKGPGDVQEVPEDKAKLLMNHPDVWKDAPKAAERKEDPLVAEAPQSKRITETEDDHVAAKIHLMPKEDLIRYALTEFNERIDPELPDEDVLAAVTRLMHTRA